MGKQRRGAGSGNIEQLHVRDVEQPGLLARVQVLLHHAGRIGERHRPAGKPAKARTGGLMQIFERQVISGFCQRPFFLQSRAQIRRHKADRFVPLCRKPERLAQPDSVRRRLHLRRGGFPRLSRVSYPVYGSFA